MADVTSDDLALYLGADEVNEDRADLLLAQAVSLCESIVSPLPDAASVVVLSVAARAYTNPQGVTQEVLGSYSVARPWPGVFLTKGEKSTLRRLSGSGGAFTIDPTPADAGPDLVWAQRGTLSPDPEIVPPFYGFTPPPA